MVPPDARAFLSTVDFTKLLIGTIDKLCVEGMAIADFSMGMLRTQLDAGGDSRVFDCLVTDAAVSEGVPAFGGGSPGWVLRSVPRISGVKRGPWSANRPLRA